MEPTTDTPGTLTIDEAIGLDIMARAERPDGAITIDEATRIARAVGWPPPRLDDSGAIRAPTADELARWESPDPAIVDSIEWPELGTEIEHRSPAIYASALAAQRATVLALRASDRQAIEDCASDEGASLDDDTPITTAEIAEWDRVGRVLATSPASLRRILATLAAVGDKS